MRKTLRSKNLHERTWLAVTLAVSLAAFGCTTNRTPGAGEPYIGGPGVGPSAPSSHISSNRATTAMPPPMTSSYQRDDALPTTITTRSTSRLPLTADEAAAIIAGQQRVRVLGPANPGVSGGYHSDGLVTGQVRDSASIVNPQMTLNSSLTSSPTVVISSGVGGGAAAPGVVVSGSSIVANSTNAPLVSTNDGSAPVFTRDLRTATPTTAAIPVTPGMFAAGGTNVSPGAVSTRTTRTATPVTTSSTATSSVRVPLNRAATTTTANSSVKVVNTNGRLVMTNTSNQ